MSRKPGEKTDNAAVRKLVREKPPLVMFGSYNERMYLAEMRRARRPTSRRRSPARSSAAHTGTPFMGYAGATYVVQEVCNALFDALFHILPLGTDLDRVEATPSRAARASCRGTTTRRRLLDAIVEAQPVLVRISAAKRLRDRAERDARAAGEARVTRRVARGRRACAERAVRCDDGFRVHVRAPRSAVACSSSGPDRSRHGARQSRCGQSSPRRSLAAREWRGNGRKAIVEVAPMAERQEARCRA